LFRLIVVHIHAFYAFLGLNRMDTGITISRFRSKQSSRNP